MRDRSLDGASVLVTGATGYIGSRLARRLQAREGARVTGVGRRLERVPELRERGVRLVRADLTGAGSFREHLEGTDVVFHLAGWTRGDRRKAYPVNVVAAERLTRRSAEAGIERFVHVSSIGAYGLPDRRIVAEDTPLQTDSDDPYGRTKARGEVGVRAAAADGGLDLVVLRPAMVWGPGAPTWTLAFSQRVRRGRPVLVGDGRGHFHPLYIENLLDALVLAATSRRAPGEAFNVCEEPLRWRDYLEPYGRLWGRDLRSVPWWVARILVAANVLPGVRTPLDRTRLAFATGRFVFSAEKARRVLGWSPRVGRQEAVRRTTASLRERRRV